MPTLARASLLSFILLSSGALSACGAVVRAAPNQGVRHNDGAHYHAFAAALRSNEGAPTSLGRMTVAGPSTYVVQRGDTLYSLARQHSVSVQELAHLNGLSRPEALPTGLRLRLPVKAQSSLAVAAPQRTPVPVATGVVPPAAPVLGAPTPPGALTSPYTLRWPVTGAITSRFGSRSGRAHDGIDIGAVPGTQVLAAADGDVVFADAHGGYGNVVILRHSNGLLTIYAHHERNLVRKGQRVHSGDAIAKVGVTGRSTGPHLHFEVRRGVRPENPLRFLPP